ncbi:MAG: IMP dehydrogenase [Candidatus Sungbacteria bacterium]|nr:IMP dehydrogenase [Candidatus Sungbacteria bacterium]
MTRSERTGLSAQEFFEKYHGVGVKFDNFILHNRYVNFPRSEISTATELMGIRFSLPVFTSPMDTVTKARMAAAVADAGGIGIIHVNLPSSQQARESNKVKYNGFIIDPIVLHPDAELDMLELVRVQFSHVPVTENGRRRGKLVGMISTAYRPRPQDETVGDCMDRDPAVALDRDILSAASIVDTAKARAMMRAKRARSLAVVDSAGHLVGLIVASDLRDEPNGDTEPTLDANGRRVVGAAIITDPEDYERRVPKLLEAGVDVLCIDTAQGDSIFVETTLAWIKKRYPQARVIAGNISTPEAAMRLIRAGADALRVGNGSGLVCKTQEVTGAGATLPTAIYHIAAVARQYDIPVIADGGIRDSGDIVKALALGASAVMVGTMVAALPDSAAPIRNVMVDGRPTQRKMHRGMASQSAYQERVVPRYGDTGGEVTQMPEGTEIYLEPSTMPSTVFFQQLRSGIMQGFNYLGVRNIAQLQHDLDIGDIRLEYIHPR